MSLDSSCWYRVTADHTIASLIGQQLIDVCANRMDAWASAGNQRPDAAVFRTDPSGETTDFFFSPGSLPLLGDLIERYEGVACEAPAPDSLTRLLGPEDAWNRILGGR